MIKTFDEWLGELEGFSLRMERVYDDLVDKKSTDEENSWQTIKSWLKAAFDSGYEAGEFNQENLIQDLKREVGSLRKEIAGLREERRDLLDNDYPPGYNHSFQG